MEKSLRSALQVADTLFSCLITTSTKPLLIALAKDIMEWIHTHTHSLLSLSLYLPLIQYFLSPCVCVCEWCKFSGAGRVIPMKGLTDDLICSVEDNLARPRPLSALTDRDLGRGYRPPGSSRYSANTNKHLFAVGVGEYSNSFCLEYHLVSNTIAYTDPLCRSVSHF